MVSVRKVIIMKAVDEVRQSNGYDVMAASDAAGLKCEDESLAVQSSKEEADINTIVRRFGITGQLPQSLVLPNFEDYGDDIFDFQSAQHAIMEAERQFMSVPPEIRARFENSPQLFLEFCSDVENLPELRKMGLAKPVEVVVDSRPEHVQNPPRNADGTFADVPGVGGGK